MRPLLAAVSARSHSSRAEHVDRRSCAVHRMPQVRGPVPRGCSLDGSRRACLTSTSWWWARARRVARKISGIVFLAPDDTEVRLAERDVGWILDRMRFDAFLAAEAAQAGV